MGMMASPFGSYLFTLGAVSTTFVGFSALIMVFRQTAGGGLSPLDSWITLVFVQLGFLVTAGSLVAPLLMLCGVRESLVWRVCSGALALVIIGFATTYPARRRGVSGARTPAFVWFDLFLLAACALVLLANMMGRPIGAGAASYAVGLTGILFTAGVGYLHALGSLHRETKRARARRPSRDGR
jgi:hypothetical protein